MPAIVACPECGSKLRVPDDLSGQAVRCARCGTAFTAPAVAAEKVVEPPPPRDPAFPPPPPRPARPGGGDAFNLDLSLDDPSPAAGRPRPSSADDRSPDDDVPRRPTLNTDHDDLQDCPYCGKQTHRNYLRCPYCGERLGRGERGRRPAFGRRDAEPHRGSLVLTLGIVGLVCTFGCPPVGLVLGIVTWALGHGDLNKIKRGEMDPEGEGLTQGGWVCGIISTVLGFLVFFGCGSFFFFAQLMNPNRW